MRTLHLLPAHDAGTTPFVAGITEFQPGAVVGFHSHNCAESVLVLEGRARFEAGDVVHELAADDLTFVPAGVAHRLRNNGSGVMRLFFVYGAAAPTRTMIDSGETFPIGSDRDVVGRNAAC